MTRKRWYTNCKAVAARAACAVMIAGLAGPGAGQDAPNSYAQALADADSFRMYNEQIERLLASQAEEIALLEADIVGLDATAAAVPQLLEQMFDSLAEFVAADLPFLVEERSQRLDRLRELMAQEDVRISERYRRLMEAYQIELNYGRDMEAYRAKLDDGREADFIRLGRVSLIYRTVDGTEAGYWDAANRAWVADPRYARPIGEALSIATEVSAPDLVTLPVPAPEETRS